MRVHRQNRWVKFVTYQGHRVEVKITGGKSVSVCRKPLQSEAGERQSLSYVHTAVQTWSGGPVAEQKSESVYPVREWLPFDCNNLKGNLVYYKTRMPSNLRRDHPRGVVVAPSGEYR